MELFIGHLAENTTPGQLRGFLNDFLEHLQFQLVETTCEDGDLIFAHAVIEPDRLARKAIKRLNLQVLNGQPVRVREYYRRAGNSDRRSPGAAQVQISDERRRMERRRRRVLKALHAPWPSGTGLTAQPVG